MTAAPRARPSRRVAPLLVAALVVGAAALGCHRDIHLLPVADPDGGAGAGVGGAAGVGGGAGIGGAAGGGPDGAAGGGVTCAGGLGPPIMLPTATGSVCASTLEERGHRFGLCTCDALTLGSGLRTDAFDSTDSSFNDETWAAVGIDGVLTTTKGAELRAGGAIYVAGPGGVNASEHLQSGASFQSNGPLTMLSSNADLLANASVNGPLSGQVKVGGILQVPASVDVGPQVQADSVITGIVSVTPPCDCTDGFVDLQSAMTMAAAANNDSAAGLDPDALKGPVTISQRLDLYCGTYYLKSVQATAPITLAVHGRVLLAVAGDVSVQAGGLTVTLDSGAELDLLIGGWLTAAGGGTIGAPSAPARFRIWVAGTDSLLFDSQPTVAAVIHAPNASVSAPDGLTISGSLLTKSLILGGDSQSSLHYDRAILKAGAPCGEPAAAAVP